VAYTERGALKPKSHGESRSAVRERALPFRDTALACVDRIPRDT